jgi:hypothetical protein
MWRTGFLCLFTLVLGANLLVAQDEKKPKAGPKAGDFMPGSFECFNVNGAAKGRSRCLVSAFALYPAVIVFTKEPAAGKDGSLNELLQKLDELAEEYEYRAFSVGVVFLSPDARDAANSAEALVEKVKKTIDRAEIKKFVEQDKEITKRIEALPEDERDQARKAAELAELGKRLTKLAEAPIQEAVKRKELHERLATRAKKYKHLILASYPLEGPAKYKLDAKADLTLFFYERMKIRANYTVSPDGLQTKDVEEMVKRIREDLPLRKKAK